ncbi:hypothetical protein [Tenacibaculum sp. M341]|uniref:hypothetical protein n=1 Tax=Tenacibaculum sp. M341 TaxID=2530339 RepID=UPI00104EE863|nr:hypothetical protein [Tenacibaculum sp. M341]TCI95014.1 hypothetical protein EYW44_01445 [Tenacibaculum sp. M341]
MNAYLLFFLVLISSSVSSQNNERDQKIYALFDNTVNQINTKLSYGTVYKEKYIKKIKENHNFFVTDQFKKGSINYRGEVFCNVFLKYDIVDDFIVLKILNLDGYVSIVPEKELVKSFQIEDRSFIKTEEYGFVENVFKNDGFQLLKKHLKFVKENQDDKYIHHTFKIEKETFVEIIDKAKIRNL